jgi:hypothetical protein
VAELTEIFDVKNWMSDVMDDNVKNIQQVHYFFFYKKENSVRMKYKNHVCDASWFPKPVDENDDLQFGYRMLKVNTYFIETK